MIVHLTREIEHTCVAFTKASKRLYYHRDTSVIYSRKIVPCDSTEYSPIEKGANATGPAAMGNIGVIYPQVVFRTICSRRKDEPDPAP